MASWALPSPTTVVPTLSPSIDRPRSWNVAFVHSLGSNSSSPFVSSVSNSSGRSSWFRATRVRFAAADDGWCPSSTSGLPAVDEAREAVVEILQEFGASQEDSICIAANSPCYVEMLVGNVQELDELGLWGSWNNEIVEENVDMSRLSFRKKVYYMAKSKGDKGVLPYLESIGVKLSSALLISRYLSSERLPQLINKMEARHGGLSMLGHKDASFPYLVESFPKLLLCSVENHFKPLVGFLELLGVPEAGISTILLLFPPIIFRDMEKEIKPKLCAFSKEIFASSVDNTLRKKVSFLADFGISRDCLRRVVRKYPELLLLDTDNTLLPRMSFLMSVGLSKREVCSMICRFSPILGYSIEMVLKPKLDFLLRTMKKPLKEIVEYPRYFSYSLDKKIKPRFWVTQSRKLECSLKDMLSKNNDEFAQEYMGIGRLLVVPSVPPKDEEVDSLLGVPGEIQKLQRSLRKIQSVLRDAEKRRIQDEDEDYWLMELKDVVYDADDECWMEAEKWTPADFLSLLSFARSSSDMMWASKKSRPEGPSCNSMCLRRNEAVVPRVSRITSPEMESGMVGKRLEEDAKALVEQLTKQRSKYSETDLLRNIV
ncbi:hypothetical protein B296_00012379 [Ensete ventricosum]|uniref:Disease resistance N-terminal domain-containing protein n=1 Tax=Ensete ventricosum TaxID=4639 RepID=A0A426Z7Y0_ENSVE|nr:hypothetical protein B296_00012379 [Ensete ventricosum]